MSDRRKRRRQPRNPSPRCDFVQCFDTFWNEVNNAECDIRENGHLERLHPRGLGDFWDEGFERAYLQVHPLLKKCHRTRFYPVPVGLRFFSRPLKATTAHEALLYFLNPPVELHGEPGVLDSAEYCAIKQQAMAEVNDCDIARLKRTVRPKQKSNLANESDVQDSLALVLSMLNGHHRVDTGDEKTEPLTQDEIAQMLDVSQTTVSRSMQLLFSNVSHRFSHKTPGRRYRALCDAGEICHELRRVERRLSGLSNRELQIENLDQIADRRQEYSPDYQD